MMAEPLDFRCDDCGAEPESPCVYVPPINEAYCMGFWLKQQYASPRQRWKNIWVKPRTGQPFVETLQIYLRAYAYQMEWADETAEEILRGIPEKLRQVGNPLRSGKVHNARRRAVWNYHSWSEDEAMREYLGEWLQQFGSIFEETR